MTKRRQSSDRPASEVPDKKPRVDDSKPPVSSRTQPTPESGAPTGTIRPSAPASQFLNPRQPSPQQRGFFYFYRPSSGAALHSTPALGLPAASNPRPLIQPYTSVSVTIPTGLSCTPVGSRQPTTPFQSTPVHPTPVRFQPTTLLAAPASPSPLYWLHDPNSKSVGVSRSLVNSVPTSTAPVHAASTLATPACPMNRQGTSIKPTISVSGGGPFVTSTTPSQPKAGVGSHTQRPQAARPRTVQAANATGRQESSVGSDKGRKDLEAELEQVRKY